MQEEDSPDHMWKREALTQDREDASMEIRSLDPRALSMAIKCGTAPAMKANMCATFCGKEGQEYMKEMQTHMCGHRGERRPQVKNEKIVQGLDEEEECTASELMQSTVSVSLSIDIVVAVPMAWMLKQPRRSPHARPIYKRGGSLQLGMGPEGQ